MIFAEEGSKGVSDIVCDKSRISNNYMGTLTVKDRSYSMDKAIGLSLDGVLLFPALENHNVDGTWTGKYVDDWYPGIDNVTEKETYLTERTNNMNMDVCLGMVSDAGEYTLKSTSDCIFGATPAGSSQATNSGILTGLKCDKCMNDMKLTLQ